MAYTLFKWKVGPEFRGGGPNFSVMMSRKKFNNMTDEVEELIFGPPSQKIRAPTPEADIAGPAFDFQVGGSL